MIPDFSPISIWYWKYIRYVKIIVVIINVYLTLAAPVFASILHYASDGRRRGRGT